jgi:hypothetical protein
MCEHKHALNHARQSQKIPHPEHKTRTKSGASTVAAKCRLKSGEKYTDIKKATYYNLQVLSSRRQGGHIDAFCLVHNQNVTSLHMPWKPAFQETRVSHDQTRGIYTHAKKRGAWQQNAKITGEHLLFQIGLGRAAAVNSTRPAARVVMSCSLSKQFHNAKQQLGGEITTAWEQTRIDCLCH